MEDGATSLDGATGGDAGSVLETDADLRLNSGRSTTLLAKVRTDDLEVDDFDAGVEEAAVEADEDLEVEKEVVIDVVDREIDGVEGDDFRLSCLVTAVNSREKAEGEEDEVEDGDEDGETVFGG